MRIATAGTSGQAGKQRLVRVGEGGRRVAQGRRRDPHHLVGHPGRLRGGHGQPHRGEDVDVVALGDRSFDAVAKHRRERRARGDQRTSVGPVVQFGGVRLGTAGRVGQREDDGPIGLAGHFAHDVLGESAGGSGQAEQHPDVDVVHDVRELGGTGQTPVRHAPGGLSEFALCHSQIRAIVGE